MKHFAARLTPQLRSMLDAIAGAGEYGISLQELRELTYVNDIYSAVANLRRLGFAIRTRMVPRRDGRRKYGRYVRDGDWLVKMDDPC